jgi:hypothetical protein
MATPGDCNYSIRLEMGQFSPAESFTLHDKAQNERSRVNALAE